MTENATAVSIAEVCETCGRGAQYALTCSSGFHMCRACTWREGERITTCRDCQETEAAPLAQASGVTRYVVLCDLELARQDNVSRTLADLPGVRWWRYIPNAWLVLDLHGRDAAWWRDFVRRAGAPEFAADLRSRIVVLCATDEDWSAVLPSGEADWMHTVWKPEGEKAAPTDAAATKEFRCNCGIRLMAASRASSTSPAPRTSDHTLAARCICGQQEIPAGADGMQWYWQHHSRVGPCVLELPNQRCWCGRLRSEHVDGHAAVLESEQLRSAEEASEWTFCRAHRLAVEGGSCPHCHGDANLLQVVPAATAAQLTEKVDTIRQELVAADDVLRGRQRPGSLFDIAMHIRDALRVLGSTATAVPMQGRTPMWAVFQRQDRGAVFAAPSQAEAAWVASQLNDYSMLHSLPHRYDVDLFTPRAAAEAP